MKLSPRFLSFAAGLTVALAATLPTARAEDPNKPWYGGLSVGQSMIKFSDDFLSIEGVPATATSLNNKKETDTGYKVYAGYRLFRNFAIEGGYTDFGKFSAERDLGVPPGGFVQEELKITGWHLDAVGILPLGSSFSLFGKLGGIYNQVKGSFTTSGGVTLAPGESANQTHTGVNLKYGLGAAYDFTNTFSIRAEWERASQLGDDKVGKGDVDLVSVGVLVHF
jgi:OOP family OmpA-OmpF porin